MPGMLARAPQNVKFTVTNDHFEGRGERRTQHVEHHREREQRNHEVEQRVDGVRARDHHDGGEHSDSCR